MIYLFGEFALDTGRRELRRGHELIGLEPQVFDLLEFLICTRERVVSRDDLIETVWKGRIVSESTLASRINAARAAIGDDGSAQRLIRTLPRKGLRFVAEVREQVEAAALPEGAASAAVAHAPQQSPREDRPVIAVLPFTNFGSDPSEDYFADGMAEEIVTTLAYCSGISVIARNSSFTFKGKAVDIREVGRELGAGYVLEGSVRRNNDQLRIIVQLIEASAGTHIWADRFDGDLADVFELQDTIARSAAAAIEPRLQFTEARRLHRRSDFDASAYDLWLRALALAGEFTVQGMMEAQRCLEQALAINPNFALAMAALACNHAQIHFQGWVPPDDEIRAIQIRRAWNAAELANDDANVLWMAAFAIWTLARDADSAKALFRRSLSINPNSAIALTSGGWFEAANGDPEKGREMIETSQRLNPRHPRPWPMLAGMAFVSIAQEKFCEAVTWAEKAVVDNRRVAATLRTLAVALAKTGNLARAREIVAELLAIEPTLTVSGLRMRLPVMREEVLRTYQNALSSAGLPQ